MWSHNHSPRQLPKEGAKNVHTKIYNCPKLEAAKTTFNEWTDEQTDTGASYEGIIFSNKKKWTIKPQTTQRNCILLSERSQSVIPNLWHLGKGKTTETGKRPAEKDPSPGDGWAAHVYGNESIFCDTVCGPMTSGIWQNPQNTQHRVNPRPFS